MTEIELKSMRRKAIFNAGVDLVGCAAAGFGVNLGMATIRENTENDFRTAALGAFLIFGSTVCMLHTTRSICEDLHVVDTTTMALAMKNENAQAKKK